MNNRSLTLVASAFAGLIVFGTTAFAADNHGSNGNRGKECLPYCAGSGVNQPGPAPNQPPKPPHVKPPHNGGGGHGHHHGNWSNDGGWGGDYGYGWRPSYNFYVPLYRGYDSYGGPDYGYDSYDGPDYGYDGYADDDYYDQAPVRRPVASSCSRAARALRSAGYRSVKPLDCKGSTFAFRAVKSGKQYKVTVNARTGRIQSRVRL